jgi:hypothetical protein
MFVLLPFILCIDPQPNSTATDHRRATRSNYCQRREGEGSIHHKRSVKLSNDSLFCSVCEHDAEDPHWHIWACSDGVPLEAKMTGYALNIAIGLQVLLGALTTGLAAALSGRQVSLRVYM